MDILTFDTADGEQFIMPNGVFSYETFPGNFGAPPTNYTTKQGYQQHGVTEIAYTLQPRDFEIEFWRAAACDRATYWANRTELLNFFRPNRNGPLIFTVTYADGTQRSLTVRADPGPQYPSVNSNDWNIRESLHLIAFDPVWFDPTEESYTPASSSPTELVFPITFPIQFGAAGLLFAQVLTYTGTWKTYPTITLSGPYTTVTIANSVTDAAIFMTAALAAGEQRIITLTPGNQSVVDQLGVNKFGDLGPLSDLIHLAILPTPEAPGGVQTLSINMIGGSAGVSAASVRFQNRFFGI